eukprot:scaffold819_cov105-Isochrysis_galbana.AAC.1
MFMYNLRFDTRAPGAGPPSWETPGGGTIVPKYRHVVAGKSTNRSRIQKESRICVVFVLHSGVEPPHSSVLIVCQAPKKKRVISH